MSETLPEPLVPRYGSASLAEIVPSLMSALGMPGLGNPLGVEPLACVCLLLIDGLGWQLLRSNAAGAPCLASLLPSGQALTTGFPATTSASVTSLGTGRPPGEHGIVGYPMAIHGHHRPMNTLRWALYGPGPNVDLLPKLPPELLQPQPTLFEQAQETGIRVIQIGPPFQARSGLTRAALRGGTFRAAYSIGDLEAEAIEALRFGPRTFVYAYHADLDTTGHIRGTFSDSWKLQLAEVDRLAATIAGGLPADSALAITGDHGMVDLKIEDRVDVDAHPELMEGVRMLAGEARSRHVYTHAGAARGVLQTWRAVLGDRMWVASREEAIAAGWFGPVVPDRVRPHIGDVVAAAFGPVGVVQRSVDNGLANMIGHHGSMTAEEQLVPFLLLRR
ncbi:MAG: alkaline phosphatase family protein [Chloroflexota bacterium]|nr:alkaline phosphatase family protein [Chloroflexota bacterium]